VDSNPNNSTEDSSTSEQTEQIKTARTPKSFKPTKIIGFPQRRIEVVFYGEDGKPSGYMQIKKRKSEHLFTKILPKGKKNPDKKVLASIGKYPMVAQVYTYTNNEAYVYIHKGADYVKLDREEFLFLFSQLIGMLDVDKQLKEELMIASITLDLKKYARPHMRVKAESIKALSLDEIVEEFKQESDKRKDEFGDYK
jgi:hypothetical protein